MKQVPAGGSLDDSIIIRGARVHNRLTVVTGSGKSSLVFDTVTL
jgi:excinuclease UvrABC ATPase subunit